MAPNSEEDGPRLTSVKDGVWGNHDDTDSKVSKDEIRNSSRLNKPSRARRIGFIINQNDVRRILNSN
jgi:hypothetical protein